MKIAKERTFFSTKDVLKRLSVSRNKFRGLTTALEKQGYSFTRNKNNQRLFFEKDIQVLTGLLSETRLGSLLDEAAAHVTGHEPAPALLPAEEKTGLALETKHSLPIHQQPFQTLSLSADQFQQVVEQVAAAAAEKTAEKVVRKYDSEIERMIERRDRELVSRLREFNDTHHRKRWLFQMPGRKRSY